MAVDAGNAYLTINAVDVGAKVLSIGALDQNREEIDITAMGASIRTMQATLEASVELQIVFKVDDWSDTMQSTLATMWSNPATAYAIAIRPTNTTKAPTNPEFQFSARLIKNPLFDQAQPGQVYKRTIGLRRTTAITTVTS